MLRRVTREIASDIEGNCDDEHTQFTFFWQSNKIPSNTPYTHSPTQI